MSTKKNQTSESIVSKQLKYYRKFIEKINQNRRLTYRKNKSTKWLTNHQRETKSCNIIERIFGINNKYIDLQSSENNPILSLFTLVKRAHMYMSNKSNITRRIQPKTNFSFYPKYMRTDTLLLDLMFYMAVHKVTSFGYGEFKENFRHVNRYKLKRAIQKLVKLKWIIRSGHADIATYAINPFLDFLLELNFNNYIYLVAYASHKLDFFDLLNIPLISFLKSGKKAKKIEITSHKTRIGSIKTIFNHGYISIKIHTEDGLTYKTYLPVNLHGPTGFGKNNQRKLIEHYCIPINWSLFDVKKSVYYSKKDTQLGKNVHIHFDNSISILHNRFRFLFGYTQWTNALKKWQNHNYLEFRDFKTLNELFDARFIQDKRRGDLFKEIGLSKKDMKHNHRKKRKYVRKSTFEKNEIRPVDNNRYEKMEMNES